MKHHSTFLESYSKTFASAYLADQNAPENFEQVVLGKRSLKSFLSQDLAYNMALYYDGYEPD